MNKARKLFALLIAMLMAVVLALPAFADENGQGGSGSGSEATDSAPTYTITINNSTKGHTYEAYQVFAGDLSGGVLSNIVWGDGVNGDALLTALQEDETIGSTFTGCENAADVAAKLTSENGFTKDSEKMKAFADIVGQHLTTTTSGTCNDGTLSGNYYTYKISGLAAGYYLIQDQAPAEDSTIDAYTRYILKVVSDTPVTPKSDVPSVEKKVKENVKYNQDDGYGQRYNDVADWNIGDSVPFKLIGTLPSNLADYDSYNYVFHDTLSNGLTYNSTPNGAKVYVVNGEDRTDVTSQFSISCTTKENSSNSLTISCNDIKKLTGVSVTASSKIVVEYTATLNTNAEIGLDGNPNEVYLEFSNNPNQGGEGDTGETPKDEVIVFTYELDTTKVDGSDKTTKLKDAQFVLYKVVNGTNLFAQVDGQGKLTGWAPASTVDTTISYPENSTLTSDTNGLFKVIGLDDGTYYLREIKAPDGYNLMNGDVTIVIAATTVNNQKWNGVPSTALTELKVNNQSNSGDITEGKVDVTVENNKGATLPETGGMGTTLFYIIGGVLVVGAGVLLVTKKRMGNHSEQ